MLYSRVSGSLVGGSVPNSRSRLNSVVVVGGVVGVVVGRSLQSSLDLQNYGDFSMTKFCMPPEGMCEIL